MIEETVINARSVLYPVLVFLMPILLGIIYPIVAKIQGYKRSKHYWEVWGISLVIILLIGLVFVLAPDWVLEISNKFIALFK